jgi:hypothetical protein
MGDIEMTDNQMKRGFTADEMNAMRDEARRQRLEEHQSFLTVLDGMIESTEEFICDDGLRADDHRIADLAALLHVRQVYSNHFGTEEDNSEDQV